jgi:hypothetical protein
MRTLPEKYLSGLPLAKDTYEIDLAVLDRYQAFSAEVLRMALLGLAGYGFLIANVLLRAPERLTSGLSSPRYALMIGALSLALCAMCALGHRFYSTDALTHYVRRLRARKRLDESAEFKLEEIAEKEEQSLGLDLNRCRRLLAASIASLILGALCVAWSFAAAIFP